MFEHNFFFLITSPLLIGVYDFYISYFLVKTPYRLPNYYAMVTRIQYVYCNVDLMLVYYLFISLLFFYILLSVYFFLIFLPLNIDLQVICSPVYIDLISFFVLIFIRLYIIVVLLLYVNCRH